MWVNKKSPISIVLRTEKNKGIGLLNVNQKNNEMSPHQVVDILNNNGF